METNYTGPIGTSPYHEKLLKEGKVITSLEGLTMEDFLNMKPSQNDPDFRPEYNYELPHLEYNNFKVIEKFKDEHKYKLIGPNNFEKNMFFENIMSIYSNEGFIIFKEENFDTWFNTNSLHIKKIRTY